MLGLVFYKHQTVTFKDSTCKCVLYPSIANKDSIDSSADAEFAVGDDDINNVVEPKVFYCKQTLKKPITELNDYNLTTSASVDKGDCIEYTYDLKNTEGAKVEIRKIFFFNGNRKSIADWKKSGRIKKVSLFVNGKPKCCLFLTDTYKMQTFGINKITAESGQVLKVKFKIKEMYNASDKKKFMISEIMFSGK